jgi:hypothetical protein
VSAPVVSIVHPYLEGRSIEKLGFRVRVGVRRYVRTHFQNVGAIYPS